MERGHLELNCPQKTTQKARMKRIEEQIEELKKQRASSPVRDQAGKNRQALRENKW